MFQIPDTKLWIGDRASSSVRSDPEWAVVNTAKTVHIAIMGWGQKPPRDHPNYITLEDGQLLSFNWVDGPADMYKWSGAAAFIQALDFIDKWLPTKSVLINCDLGQSRSPTVALLYLAKRAKTINGASFESARQDFVKLYPGYAPSGIADYVASRWGEIN